MLNTIDYIVFALAMIGGIWGAIKGFIDEVSSKFGFILGFIFALMFTGVFAQLFVQKFEMAMWLASFISYVIIFIVGFCLMKGLGSVLSGICETANISIVDNLLGFFLGVFESMVIMGLLVMVLGHQKLFNLSAQFDQSLLVTKIISPFFNGLAHFVKGIF